MSTSISAPAVSAQSRLPGKRLKVAWPPGDRCFHGGSNLCHLVLCYLLAASQAISEAPLIAAIVIGGVPMIEPLVRKLLHGEFGADHLAVISIITAVLLHQYLVAAIVILVLSGGTALEEFATRRASSVQMRCEIQNNY